MLNSFFHKLKLAFGDTEIRRRILFLVAALVLFRVLASIPIPGVDKTALASFFAGNQFFGLLNIFSGGGLEQLSVVMLGVGPYITASVVNLAIIEAAYKAGETVSPASLLARGLVRRAKGRAPFVKILGTDSLTKVLSIENCSISTTARAAILAAGGTIYA